jgi:hypothetical protein
LASQGNATRYNDNRDVSNFPSQWVIVKCDSGPGQENLEMLAQLWVLCIYLFPSMPKSASVTQEMDQLYSLFMSIVRKNLEILHPGLLWLGSNHCSCACICRVAIAE